MSTSPTYHIQIIAIDDDQQGLDFETQCYFGQFELHLDTQSQLTLFFSFKRQLVGEDLESQELTVIGRQQFELTKKMKLDINDHNLTESLRKVFGDVKSLAHFLMKQISNPLRVVIDKQKMELKYKDNPVVELHFGLYKKVEKSQLLNEMKRFQQAFSHMNQSQVDWLDPELITSLDLSLSEDQEESTPQEQQEKPQQIDIKPFEYFRQQPFVREDKQQRHRNPQSIMKQNQIPIYERFKGINLNISRKEKVKLSQKMLRIGYCKEDIIRFFSGDAQTMQHEHNHVPDYRNPQTQKYKYIHLLVAQKQNKRHNQLHQKYGLPPVPPLPEYSSSYENTKGIIRSMTKEYFQQKEPYVIDQ